MKAKKKPVKQIDFASLGMESPAESVTLLNLEAMPERSGAKILDGDVEEKVTELVRILKQDEKVL
jgi:electron transfer flavoprotein beta subunit